MSLVLRFAARSHAGLLRSGNEDSVYAGPRLLAVADGMGGHAAGEVASAVAIAAIAPLDEDVPGADLLAALRAAALSANQHLRDMVAVDGALDGMGTTLTAVLSAGSRLGLLHVGDSRAYLLRDDELSQITHDHTLVQTLVDEGRISQEEASTHPQRSVITRVLDGRDSVELDLSVREVRAGDRYLLCSDGLTGPVGSLDTLREALLIPNPQDAVDQLVALALKGGGPDNITVIVADALDESVGEARLPIVAGAASDAPQEAPSGIADSPASRARVAEGRDTAAPLRADSPNASRNGSGRRTAFTVVGILVVLLAGAGVGWTYVRSQYYVGLDGQKVAIYRGVTGHVGNLKLSSVQVQTDLSSNRLSEVDQSRLQAGIVAADEPDALAIVQRLVTGADASCPVEPTPGPTPTVRPLTTPAPRSTPTPAARSCP